MRVHRDGIRSAVCARILCLAVDHVLAVTGILGGATYGRRKNARQKASAGAREGLWPAQMTRQRQRDHSSKSVVI